MSDELRAMGIWVPGGMAGLLVDGRECGEGFVISSCGRVEMSVYPNYLENLTKCL